MNSYYNEGFGGGWSGQVCLAKDRQGACLILEQGPALLNPNQLKVTLGLPGGTKRRMPTVEGQRLLS